jgi:hypothetical protein
MKKILSVLVLAIVGYYAFPQEVKNSVATVNPGGAPLSGSAATANEPTTEAKNVSSKAMKNFNKAFKNVTDEKWYEMPDGYRANFTLDNIRHRLDYDKKGNWLHTIRYYDGKNLTTDVRRLVISTYLDYTITLVEEIEKPRNVISYVIHLEGQTNWINVKVSDQEITELSKVNKS